MRFVLFTYFLICFSLVKGQISFCPPGAVWNNSFVHIPAWNSTYVYANDRIAYVGDSIIGLDTVKVVTNRFYYSDCYNMGGLNKITFIKQKGDTIFFKNLRTQNNWEILYNFAALPGSSWQTKVLKASNITHTYTTIVDSVKQISENAFSLKRLYTSRGPITERYGKGFLFNFSSFPQGCDGYYHADFLCYSDSSFGQIKGSERPCSFSGSEKVGLNETYLNEFISIGPNPVSDKLILNFKKTLDGAEKLNLSNHLGQTILEIENLQKENEIDLNHLAPGIYYLELKSGQEKFTRKIVKE